ncbi:MAG: DUF3810 domain-containing protein [Oscillospiraceae bacterium]|nr:DUF3810 domain-containing protein [Oscillospiraceae bacterium]
MLFWYIDMKKTLSKKYLVQYIIIAVILTVCAVICAFSRSSAAFADSYRDNVFLKLQAVFGRISGALPFSLGELMIAIAVSGGISLIAVYIVLMIQKKGKRGKISAVCSLIVLWIAAFVMLTETLNCFIMYRCSSFASVYGIGEEKFTAEELYSLAMTITEKCNEAEALIERDENGNMLITCDVYAETKAAMQNISSEYPTLSGYYPDPKSILCSGVMTRFDLLGIYFPFSLEANYNKNMYNSELPETICHEFAHLKGWIKEDEANFISYLACIESDSPELVYSGYMSALSYLRSKVYREASISDEDKAVLFSAANDNVVHDLVEKGRIFREAKETKLGTAMSVVSDKAMETSLRLNGVSDGVKSYGRFVDLLLNYYSNS